MDEERRYLFMSGLIDGIDLVLRSHRFRVQTCPLRKGDKYLHATSMVSLCSNDFGLVTKLADIHVFGPQPPKIFFYGTSETHPLLTKNKED